MSDNIKCQLAVVSLPYNLGAETLCFAVNQGMIALIPSNDFPGEIGTVHPSDFGRGGRLEDYKVKTSDYSCLKDWLCEIAEPQEFIAKEILKLHIKDCHETRKEKERQDREKAEGILVKVFPGLFELPPTVGHAEEDTNTPATQQATAGNAEKERIELIVEGLLARCKNKTVNKGKPTSGKNKPTEYEILLVGKHSLEGKGYDKAANIILGDDHSYDGAKWARTRRGHFLKLMDDRGYDCRPHMPQKRKKAP